MGIEQKLGNLGVVTYRLEDVVNWGRSGSMWPDNAVAFRLRGTGD